MVKKTVKHLDSKPKRYIKLLFWQCLFNPDLDFKPGYVSDCRSRLDPDLDLFFFQSLGLDID